MRLEGVDKMKNTTGMTRDEFADLLDRHGAEPARWPADRAAAAQALLVEDAGARADLATARRLEALVGHAVAPAPVDAATVGRVLARARGDRHRREHVVRFTPRFAFAGVTGLVLCLAVGVALGLVVPGPVADPDQGDEIAVIMLGGDDGETLPGDLL